jgi:hypothetical protein
MNSRQSQQQRQQEQQQLVEHFGLGRLTQQWAQFTSFRVDNQKHATRLNGGAGHSNILKGD